MITRRHPKPMLAALSVAVLASTSNCARTHSSSAVKAAVAHVGSVQLRALSVPPGAVELGAVEAHSTVAYFPEVMKAFSKRVAASGGNFGKVDDIRTKFEYKMHSYAQDYNCGTTQYPRTCTRRISRIGEVATTTVTGRAFIVSPEAVSQP